MLIFNEIYVYFLLIAVKVVPRSIKHGTAVNCKNKEALDIPHGPLSVGKNLDIIYTYSVTYIVSIYNNKLSTIYTLIV